MYAGKRRYVSPLYYNSLTKPIKSTINPTKKMGRSTAWTFSQRHPNTQQVQERCSALLNNRKMKSKPLRIQHLAHVRLVVIEKTRGNKNLVRM